MQAFASPSTRSITSGALTASAIAWAIVLADGAFLALGSFVRSGKRRPRHTPERSQLDVHGTGRLPLQAPRLSRASHDHYITHLEIGYAVYELAFALLFLAVAAIPLNRGESWAWWCSWLTILPLAGFAAVFGPHDTLNLIAASAPSSS